MARMDMRTLPWLVLVAGGLFEVGGDATIRAGLRAHQPAAIGVGMIMLALYGLVINQLRWDFARLLGVYVAVFAVVSVLFGRLVFGERVALSTWLGLGLIVAGGAAIQFGRR